ncbi:unnamed protein product [Brassicogethes aeneus]|uniref:Guanine nucleotide-binding protein subunit beta-like protein 1 n=1 Tax=Brassicogethes aeneus TaxID=1431903 RepID=A0A9P0AVV8_BRAAE|nr:unnamed protein product [Brassicogethes aeneus]
MAVLPPDPIFCFKGDMGHIHSLCFPKNNQNETTKLLAATEEGFVYFWNLETNRLHYKQKMGHSIQSIHSINNNVIIQEKSGLIQMFSVEEAAYTAQKSYQCEGGFCKSILLNDSCLIVPQEKSTVDVVDLSTMEKLYRLCLGEDVKVGALMCLETYKKEGTDYLLGGYETGDVILWDLSTTKKISQVKLKDHITSLTFDAQNSRGICGNASNILEIFNIDRDFKMAPKCEVTLTNDGCNVVRLRPDKKVFVVAGWDGKIRVNSWKTMRALVVLNEHKGGVTDVQFSPDIVNYWHNNIFAASGSDGRISLWNLYN